MKLPLRLAGSTLSTFLCISFFTPACTVDKVIDGTSADLALSAAQEKRVASLVDVGFSNDHAEVCVRLEANLTELNAAYEANALSNASGIPVNNPSRYYDIYCHPALASWAACALPGNQVVTLPSSECASEAEPYLRCLVESGAESLDSCASYFVSDDCDYTEIVTESPAGTSCNAESGGWYTTDSDNSLRGVPGWEGFMYDRNVVFREWTNLDELLPVSDYTNELPLSLGYGIRYADCADGSSYGFICGVPDEACGLNCYCQQGEEEQKRIVMDAVSVDADFVQKVWDACGFPALPLTPAN